MQELICQKFVILGLLQAMALFFELWFFPVTDRHRFQGALSRGCERLLANFNVINRSALTTVVVRVATCLYGRPLDVRQYRVLIKNIALQRGLRLFNLSSLNSRSLLPDGFKGLQSTPHLILHHLRVLFFIWTSILVSLVSHEWIHFS